jgi:hypothetical protein
VHCWSCVRNIIVFVVKNVIGWEICEESGLWVNCVFGLERCCF